MSAAETLRRAAALMRERAEAATSGPWLADRVHSGGVMGVAVTAPVELTADGSIIGVTDIVVPADGHHIASWHPAVALAVADWLDEAADVADMNGFIESDAALAVARAYLGEDQ